MTIRYSCEKCESVLKIRDEMAGTDAKCPKCKRAFVVPEASAKPDVEAETSDESLEDMVDMPRAVTPPVQYDTPDGFDPLDVLAGSYSEMPVAAAPPEDEAPKPSVAELMREHEANLASRKKKREKKSKAGSLAEAASVAEMMTAGTASDALTRTYDQKRGKASEPAPLTREERRQEEQKEAVKQFAIRAVPAVAGIAVLLYFLISWYNSEPLPDLSYVSGVVTHNGKPLVGVEVTFSRMSKPDGTTDTEAGSSTSSGFTDKEGIYTLKYNADNEGVVPGKHSVYIVSPAGATYILPRELQEQVVKQDETITIDIKF